MQMHEPRKCEQKPLQKSHKFNSFEVALTFPYFVKRILIRFECYISECVEIASAYLVCKGDS